MGGRSILGGEVAEGGRHGSMDDVQSVGAADPAEFAKARAEGKRLPGLHTAKFAPDRQPTIRTGVTVLTLSVLELLGAPSS